MRRCPIAGISRRREDSGGTMMQSVSVFGLGKVGLTLAACLADSGSRVTGVDIDEHTVEAIRRNPSCTTERGVAERLHRTMDRTLTVTCDAERAVHESSLTFVIVPTPSNTLGGFSIRYVMRACEQIGRALRGKSGYHLVAVVSTMLPGSSEHIVLPYLEEVSGRKASESLGYCYN